MSVPELPKNWQTSPAVQLFILSANCALLSVVYGTLYTNKRIPNPSRLRLKDDSEEVVIVSYSTARNGHINYEYKLEGYLRKDVKDYILCQMQNFMQELAQGKPLL